MDTFHRGVFRILPNIYDGVFVELFADMMKISNQLKAAKRIKLLKNY